MTESQNPSSEYMVKKIVGEGDLEYGLGVLLCEELRFSKSMFERTLASPSKEVLVHYGPIFIQDNEEISGIGYKLIQLFGSERNKQGIRRNTEFVVEGHSSEELENVHRKVAEYVRQNSPISSSGYVR